MLTEDKMKELAIEAAKEVVADVLYPLISIKKRGNTTSINDISIPLTWIKTYTKLVETELTKN